MSIPRTDRHRLTVTIRSDLVEWLRTKAQWQQRTVSSIVEDGLLDLRDRMGEPGKPKGLDQLPAKARRNIARVHGRRDIHSDRGGIRVPCEAVQYFHKPQPGMVEAYLTDASGFRWQIVEKSVMFNEWREIAGSPLPMQVSIGCRIATDNGGPTVTVWLDSGDDRSYEVRRTDLVSGDLG